MAFLTKMLEVSLAFHTV